jgi:hypothetical protein
LDAATFGELKPDFPTPPNFKGFQLPEVMGEKKSKNHQICILAFYSVAKNYING